MKENTASSCFIKGLKCHLDLSETQDLSTGLMEKASCSPRDKVEESVRH